MTEKPPPLSTTTAAPTPATPIAGELVAKPPYVGRLETVADWRRQIAKVFREMRQGKLAPEDGTKLTYVANIGAQLAKVQEELKEAAALREELARLRPMMSTSGLALGYVEEGAR
jgi:hypothetical protein